MILHAILCVVFSQFRLTSGSCQTKKYRSFPLLALVFFAFSTFLHNTMVHSCPSYPEGRDGGHGQSGGGIGFGFNLMREEYDRY